MIVLREIPFVRLVPSTFGFSGKALAKTIHVKKAFCFLRNMAQNSYEHSGPCKIYILSMLNARAKVTGVVIKSPVCFFDKRENRFIFGVKFGLGVESPVTLEGLQKMKYAGRCASDETTAFQRTCDAIFLKLREKFPALSFENANEAYLVVSQDIKRREVWNRQAFDLIISTPMFESTRKDPV